MKAKGLRFPNGIPRAKVAVPQQHSMFIQFPRFDENVMADNVIRVKEGKVDKIASYYKAIIALVSVVGTVIATTLSASDLTAVWPSGWAGAVAAAGSAVAGALVWLKRNEPTIEEATALLQRAQERAQ